MGYTDLNSLYVMGFNGGTNQGIKGGKMTVGFDEITSGKVFISFRYKMTKDGMMAPFGALYSGDTCAVSVNNGAGTYADYVADDYKIIYLDKTSGKTISIENADWHKISYYADLDTQTYEFFFDDVSQGEFKFNNTVASFDSIVFGTSSADMFQTQNYYLDDIIVCEAPDTNTRTVSFYKNGEFLENQTVAFGSSVDFPEVDDIEGHNFSGWYSDATGETAVDLSCVTENIDVYAVYKPFVIHEDFGRTSSFRIDKTNKKILTDSGFSFTATDAQFDVMSLNSGILTTEAKNVTSANDLTINFDEITSGKANIGFRFQMLSHNGNGNATGFGQLANQNYGVFSAYTKLRFGLNTETASNNTTPNTLTSDTAWHTAEYRIDKDNGTYEFYFDGVKYGYTNLSDTYLDSFPLSGDINALFFPHSYYTPTNHNYALSDVWVVLDPEANAQDLTITYMNEDNETVNATETVAFGGNISKSPNMEKAGKVFAGWTLNKGTDDVINLGMITKNYTLYPVYLSETPVVPQNIIAEVGNINTFTDAEATSIIVADSLMAAGTVDGKNIVWTANSTNLRAYDFTNMASPSFIGEYTFDANFRGFNVNRYAMAYSDGYLYAMSESNLLSIPIGSNGLPAGAETKTALSGTLYDLYVIDNYIFIANSGGNFYVYEKGANPTPVAMYNLGSNITSYIVILL